MPANPMNLRTISLFKDLICTSVLVFVSTASLSACAATPPKSTPIPIANDPRVGAATPKKAKVVEGDGHRHSKAAIPSPDAAEKINSVSKADLASLKALNERYRTAKSVEMNVDKLLKLGLIGSERKSAGKLYLAKGQLRMELEGSEKTLLVVNKKNLYAVTYPDPTLKGAATQVIKGETSSKKAQSQALTSLLGSGGFLKNFKPTALQADESGAKTYFLQPTNEQSEFKRAQLVVSSDGKEIRELHYWDARDNETSLKFSNVKFGAALDAKIFNYTPPADADVMNL